MFTPGARQGQELDSLSPIVPVLFPVPVQVLVPCGVNKPQGSFLDSSEMKLQSTTRQKRDRNLKGFWISVVMNLKMYRKTQNNLYYWIQGTLQLFCTCCLSDLHPLLLSSSCKCTYEVRCEHWKQFRHLYHRYISKIWRYDLNVCMLARNITDKYTYISWLVTTCLSQNSQKVSPNAHDSPFKYDFATLILCHILVHDATNTTNQLIGHFIIKQPERFLNTPAYPPFKWLQMSQQLWIAVEQTFCGSKYAYSPIGPFFSFSCSF